MLVRVDRDVPVPRANICDECGEDRERPRNIVRVALDSDGLEVRDPVTVRPRRIRLVHEPRHTASRDDVMRGHLSGLVAQVVHDPVERLSGWLPPPMSRDVLDRVRLAITRIDTTLMTVR